MNKLQGGGMVAVLVCAFSSGLGCSEKPSTVSMLPANMAVESWVRLALPTVVKSDTELYAQIDGAAPKYIDRGWVSSAYADYAQGGSTMQVAIHDMGNGENALAIYNSFLPVSRIGINEPVTAVIDTSIASGYASKAYTGQFYVEVSIDDRSDAALASIKAFTLEILRR